MDAERAVRQEVAAHAAAAAQSAEVPVVRLAVSAAFARRRCSVQRCRPELTHLLLAANPTDWSVDDNMANLQVVNLSFSDVFCARMRLW